MPNYPHPTKSDLQEMILVQHASANRAAGPQIMPGGSTITSGGLDQNQVIDVMPFLQLQNQIDLQNKQEEMGNNGN